MASEKDVRAINKYGATKDSPEEREKAEVLDAKLHKAEMVKRQAGIFADADGYIRELVPSAPSGLAQKEVMEEGRLGELSGQVDSQLEGITPFTTALSDDEKYAMRAKLVLFDDNGLPYVPGVGVPIADPEFQAYCIKKRNLQLKEELDAFIISQIDFSTPSARAWWESHWPDHTKKLKAFYDQQLDDQRKLAALKIYGVQDMKDMLFLFKNGMGLTQYRTQEGPPNANLLSNIFTQFETTWGIGGARRQPALPDILANRRALRRAEDEADLPPAWEEANRIRGGP